MLLSALGTSVANIALPTLAEKFHATFAQVQWVVLAYLLAITTLIVSVGKIGDIAGRRRLLLAGILLFSSASLLCASAGTLDVLIFARALQGLGAAIMMALTLSFVSETVPKQRIGSAMGLLGTMSAIGTALGPSLGGVLIAAAGWRWIFLINVPLGVAAWILAFRCLPVDRLAPDRPRSRLDLPGTLLLAMTLLAYALAMTVGRGSFGALNLALLLAAAIGTVGFMLVEKRARAPLIPIMLFADRPLRAALGMSMLVMTVMMATLVVGPFYLSRALGLTPALVGMVMSTGPIVAALTGVPAGRAVDRFGARRMTFAGLAGVEAGCLMLSALPLAAGVVGYIVPLTMITAGYALFQAANNTAVMKAVDAGQRGVVSGMLNLSRNLGLITGASFMGAIFAYASGAAGVIAAPPPAVASGMRVTFAVGVGLIAIALLLGAGRSSMGSKKMAPRA